MDDDKVQRLPDGRFAPGHRRLASREPGKANKLTRDIRQGMLSSAIAHGSDGRGKDGLPGFCSWLLANDLKAWCSIFARMVPGELKANVDHHHRALKVIIQPIASGFHYDADGQLRPYNEARTINHAPASTADEVASTPTLTVVTSDDTTPY